MPNPDATPSPSDRLRHFLSGAGFKSTKALHKPKKATSTEGSSESDFTLSGAVLSQPIADRYEGTTVNTHTHTHTHRVLFAVHTHTHIHTHTHTHPPNVFRAGRPARLSICFSPLLLMMRAFKSLRVSDVEAQTKRVQSQQMLLGWGPERTFEVERVRHVDKLIVACVEH